MEWVDYCVSVARGKLQQINAIDEPVKARAFCVECELFDASDLRRELVHGGNGVEILERYGGRTVSHAFPHSVVGSSHGVMYRFAQPRHRQADGMSPAARSRPHSKIA